MVIKESLVPRELPGNLGSRKHLILIRTEGSGREEQTILRAGEEDLCSCGEGKVLNCLELGES